MKAIIFTFILFGLLLISWKYFGSSHEGGSAGVPKQEKDPPLTGKTVKRLEKSSEIQPDARGELSLLDQIISEEIMGSEKRLSDKIISISQREYREELFFKWKRELNQRKKDAVRTENGIDSLYFRGEKIFSAPKIYDCFRSHSNLFVIAADSSDREVEKQSKSDYEYKDGLVCASYKCLFKVDSKGGVTRLSSKNEHVKSLLPMMSEGRPSLIYTRDMIDVSGRLKNTNQIVVLDLQENKRYVGSADVEFSDFVSTDHFIVIPLGLVDSKLVILTDWGETGGHQMVHELEIDF